ncbi:hypothetical protein BRADI_4g07665v3 [Brachypodium distachyon]|uniref:Uncharacterized protein n=1 Tax=Brachypodium distachyon TaxID=15368 RepID=A0A2K2CL31_BRADI|nr:hypothetical protein BRADI_4g07665v3 [Brachypodium distachyon]
MRRQNAGGENFAKSWASRCFGVAGAGRNQTSPSLGQFLILQKKTRPAYQARRSWASRRRVAEERQAAAWRAKEGRRSGARRAGCGCGRRRRGDERRGAPFVAALGGGRRRRGMRRQRGGWEIRGGGGHGRRWKARGGHGKRWKAAGRCGGTADVPVAGDAAGLRKWREEEERSAGGMEAARARRDWAALPPDVRSVGHLPQGRAERAPAGRRVRVARHEPALWRRIDLAFSSDDEFRELNGPLDRPRPRRLV